MGAKHVREPLGKPRHRFAGRQRRLRWRIPGRRVRFEYSLGGLICMQVAHHLAAYPEKTKPLIFFRKINGLAILVAGTGFEPVTFGL